MQNRNSLNPGPVAKKLRQMSKRLGVTQAELARLIGLDRNTGADEGAARDVDAALSAIAHIFADAAELTGDENLGAIWFKHQPIPGWAGKTAYDLVGEGKASLVLEYLGGVQSGVYA